MSQHVEQHIARHVQALQDREFGTTHPAILRLLHPVGDGAHSIVYRGILEFDHASSTTIDNKVAADASNAQESSKGTLTVAAKSIQFSIGPRAVQNPLSLLREIECLRSLQRSPNHDDHNTDHRSQFILRFLGPMLRGPSVAVLLMEFMPLDLSAFINEFWSSGSFSSSDTHNNSLLGIQQKDDLKLDVAPANQLLGLGAAQFTSMSSITSFLSAESFDNSSDYNPPSNKGMSIDARSGVPLRIATLLFEKICQGVAYMHSKSIVHRDLKPGNVLLEVVEYSKVQSLMSNKSKIMANGRFAAILPFELDYLQTPHAILSGVPVVFRIKISDFGQARMIKNHDLNAEIEYYSERTNTTASFDNPSFISQSQPLKHDIIDFPYTPAVSTRWYRAPELLYGSLTYDFGVDLWALGCIYAEMLLGHALLRGDSDIGQLALVHKILGPATDITFPQLKYLPDFGKLHFEYDTGLGVKSLMESFLRIDDSNPHSTSSSKTDFPTEYDSSTIEERQHAVSLIESLIVYDSLARADIMSILETLR